MASIATATHFMASSEPEVHERHAENVQDEKPGAECERDAQQRSPPRETDRSVPLALDAATLVARATRLRHSRPGGDSSSRLETRISSSPSSWSSVCSPS